MTFRQNFFLQDWFRNKLGIRLGLGLEFVFGIGLVPVSKTVALLRFVTLRPAKRPLPFLTWLRHKACNFHAESNC